MTIKHNGFISYDHLCCTLLPVMSPVAVSSRQGMCVARSFNTDTHSFRYNLQWQREPVSPSLGFGPIVIAHHAISSYWKRSTGCELKTGTIRTSRQFIVIAQILILGSFHFSPIYPFFRRLHCFSSFSIMSTALVLSQNISIRHGVMVFHL